MHVAMCGLTRLQLDQIWWMVSPQNPLKPKQPPYQQRIDTVRALGLPPRMRISHMERDFGTSYTRDTLRRACQRWPHIQFVFLMGADNLRDFHLWRGWREIIETVPIAVIARPGQSVASTMRARLGRTARLYAHARLPEPSAHLLANCAAPAWTYLTPPLNALSSTAIRRAQKMPKTMEPGAQS